MPTPHAGRRRRRLAPALVFGGLLLAATAALTGAVGAASVPDLPKAAPKPAPVDDLAALQAALAGPADSADAGDIGDAADPAPTGVAEAAEWLVELPPPLGEPVGRIRIPGIGVDRPVVEGVQPEHLALSPGHMPRTAMPGQLGNAAIAGHRTTYGAPFYDLDLLRPGDEIHVDTAVGTHTYAVVSTEIVLPTAMWTVQHRSGAWLTLIACHPKGSEARRIIVFARLVGGPNLAAVEAAFTGEYLPPRDPETGIAPRHHPTVVFQTRRI